MIWKKIKIVILSIIWIFLNWNLCHLENTIICLIWHEVFSPKFDFFFQPKHGATLLLKFLWPAHYITFITTKDNNLNVFCMCKNEQQQICCKMSKVENVWKHFGWCNALNQIYLWQV
jgi:hypothetical protein